MNDPDDPTQLVFRALAHPVRRAVLDALRGRSGLSLTELMDGHSLSRQTFTQHMDALTDADLVRYEYQGRERLHYLNAVPLYMVTDTWLSTFVNPQARALLGLGDMVAEEVARRRKRRA